MRTFLEDYTAHILEQELDLQEYIFILPSRRAVNFLKKELVKQHQASFFVPQIYSIEDFITEIAQVEIIEKLPVLLEFYKVYTSLFPKDKQEPFETVYNWSQTLIQDFNEIDRHLIDAEDFFSNLSNVKEIDHWSKMSTPTQLIKNYLAFWQILPKLYKQLSHNLRQQKRVYQGLAYKIATEKLDDYLQQTNKKHHLIGFNALNQCEQILFQKTLENGEVFWDIDASLLADTTHPASTFLRKYQKEWKYYQKREHSILPSTQLFSAHKKIETFAIPKKIGQAKMLGQILENLPEEDYSQTAIVLADETLLQPVLKAIPEKISAVNITMGLALKYTPLASFFELILHLQLKDEASLFYKDVLQIIGHPSFKMAFPEESLELKQHFVSNTLLSIERADLVKAFSKGNPVFQKMLQLIFENLFNKPNHLLENVLQICDLLNKCYPENELHHQYVVHFQHLFQRLHQLTDSTSYIQTNKTLYSIYKDLLAQESLDFKGSPFEGIQLMGMLETRVLDFKHVILVSVNEGILPSGKSDNSYIPFNLKIAFNLPTYKDKDAIYAYHFFRLIQRAEQVYLLYNNDAVGMEKAEKSRFIRQLEIFPHKNHQLRHHLVSASSKTQLKALQEISKTPAMLQKMKDLFQYGISPSALTTYIRNPFDFYKRYILQIDQVEELDEEVSFRAYGNIIHDTLQTLYEPYTGKQLEKADVEAFLNQYEAILLKQFAQHYNADAIKKGKNLIAFEIAKQQCERFLQQEWTQVEEQPLHIVAIEESKKIPFEIPQISTPTFLKGKADRVDIVEGYFRIIDYKTGKVTQTELHIEWNWENFTQDYKYGKAFQLLFYALLFYDEKPNLPMESGIFSFKNLNEGFLKFGRKIGENSRTKETEITDAIIAEFKKHLSELIQEMLNPELPFIEKEV